MLEVLLVPRFIPFFAKRSPHMVPFATEAQATFLGRTSSNQPKTKNAKKLFMFKPSLEIC
jgi:hypothetical protein